MFALIFPDPDSKEKPIILGIYPTVEEYMAAAKQDAEGEPDILYQVYSLVGTFTVKTVQEVHWNAV